MSGGVIEAVIGQRSAKDRPLRARTRVRGILLTCFVAVLTVYILESAIYLVRSDLADKVIRSLCLLLLILLFPYQRLPRRFLVVLCLYAGLFVAAAFPALVKLDGVGLLQLLKFVAQFLTLPLILFRFTRDPSPPQKLLRLPIIWACFFALQGVVLWTLVATHHEPKPDTVYMGRLDDMSEKDFGIFGYGNTYTGMPDGNFNMRPQGWFLEPSNLAAFMIYPTFMSWGIYRSTRKRRYLIAALVCLSGLIMAFSLAGYMALGGGLLSLLLVRPRRKRTRRPASVWRAVAAAVLIGAAFLVFANFLMSQMYAVSESSSLNRLHFLLARDPQTQKLVQDYWGLDTTLDLLRQNPFGLGLGHTFGFHDVTSANAFIFWMVSAGIPGILIIFALYGFLFVRYVTPCLTSSVPVARAAAAGFIGATLQGLSYGNWMSPSYVFTVAMLILAGESIYRTALGQRTFRAAKSSLRTRPYSQVAYSH